MKWAERSLSIRSREEPSLLHLSEWLKQRVLALREAFIQDEPKKKGIDNNSTHIALTSSMGESGEKCQICAEKHPFNKCKEYKAKKPIKKVELVKSIDLCFNCFKSGHKHVNCTSDNTCFVKGCGKKHHTSLHDYFLEKEKSLKAAKEKKKNQEEQNGEENAIMVCAVSPVEDGNTSIINAVKMKPAKRVFLLIVPVTIHIGKVKADTYALLDNCAQNTLMRYEFFQKLGVQGMKSKMNQGTIKEKPEEVSGQSITISISGRKSEKLIEIEEVFVQPADQFHMPSRPKLSNVSDEDIYTHLDGLDLDAVAPEEISILIGADSPESHINTEIRRGRKGQPLAFKTPYGWGLLGPSRGDCGCNIKCMSTYTSKALDSSVAKLWDETESSPKVFINLMQTRTDVDLHESVERFWKQEHCGIAPQKELAMSPEDVSALERMDRETKFINGKYYVPMLWKDSKTVFPDNISMVKKRFDFLLKKLRSDKDLFQMYKAKIDGYLQQDPPFARKMKPEEVEQRSSRTWTLPTFPVYHPRKPEVPRVVKDAAAEFHKVSLNNQLLTGPDLMNLLVGILMRFRVGEVAVAADIEAMFYQVRVFLKDADSLRFLWKDDITNDDPPDTYQMLVHIFGAKDSPTVAAYAFQRTARDNKDKFSATTLETALRSFYADDLLKSLTSTDAAIEVCKELMALSKCGGFRLHKFMSNCKEVTDALPASEVSQSATFNIEGEDESLEYALGVRWDVKNDAFTYTFKALDLPATKRGILKTTSKLFDPLGHLVPFLLRPKVIIQTLWRTGCEWDEIVNENVQKHWNKWLAGAKNVSLVKIPRQYVEVKGRSIQKIELHVFCDASEDAYGACAYLRYSFKSGEHESSLVMAKSRLAPIKVVDLPRLETNAARTGARLAKLIVQEMDLPIERIKYWSDSTLTLQYIKNTKHRLKVFVANRVSEILETSDADQWSHVPGNINPADLLTRGVSDPVKLMTNRWFIAPEFL